MGPWGFRESDTTEETWHTQLLQGSGSWLYQLLLLFHTRCPSNFSSKVTLSVYHSETLAVLQQVFKKYLSDRSGS